MEPISDVETDISESDMEECEAEVYEKLKTAGPRRIKYPNGSFRCPYCPGKKKRQYVYADILQHAVSCGFSCPRSPRDRASHRALAKLLQSDYQPVGCDVLPPNPLPEDTPVSVVSLETDALIAVEEKFVFPWFGILANVAGESVGTIKEKLTLNGLHPVRIRPVYTETRSHSGYALVPFASGWKGYAAAMTFEKHFDKFGRGKRDWVQNGNVGPKGTLYGWVAREEDYLGDGATAEYLKKNGDLRTLTEVARAESKKNELLVSDLIDRMSAKDKLLEEIGVDGDWNRVLVETMNERDELRRRIRKGDSEYLQSEGESKTLDDVNILDKLSKFSLGNHEIQVVRDTPSFYGEDDDGLTRKISELNR